MKLVFMFLLGLYSSVLAFELEESGDPDATFGEKTPSLQIINVNESNEGERVNVVLITGIVGEIGFTLSADNKIKELLDVKIDNGPDSSSKYLSANRLDYESLTSVKAFPADIYENNDINNKQVISLSIVNEDDESPTLTVTSCAMNESINDQSTEGECEFTISDPDGFLKSMQFPIVPGKQGEDSIFKIWYKEEPDDDVKEASVYLSLQENKKLDYEKVTLYNFHIEAKDQKGHPTTPLESVPVLVQVNDMPDEPPRWDSSFRAAVSIPEETATTIQVSATDGDVEINNEINYELKDITAGFESLVTIDQKTGQINVGKIDRDVGQHDTVSFTVHAYEVPDPESSLEGKMTLIIDDIDDNIAVISFSVETILADDKKIEKTIDEGTTDLQLTISANDIDLGENAIYNTVLKTIGPVDFTPAFSIIPSRGYQETSLTLAVLDPKLLNYEDPEWQVITLELSTVGDKNKDHMDVLTITLTLNDINDELPVFEPAEYTAEVAEDVKKDYTVKPGVKATDDDAEDAELSHTLVGTLANSILKIQDKGGNITTIKDDAFDYEKQQEVIVQIQAIDKNNHKTTAQLTITVTDVNDEPPRLLVSSSMSVDENVPPGTIIPTTITATDVDTDPNLEFSFDWMQSYANKNSQRLKDGDFEKLKECLKIETVRDDADKGTVTAKIETNKDLLDYEVFDSLYLYLVVTDKNTKKGKDSDSATIVISILDLNDNEPKFSDDVETVRRTVIENSDTRTAVTTVVATDDDVGTKLEYSLEAVDDSPLWMAIDKESGVISVSLPENTKLDCDDPKRDNLKYKVLASDGDHIATAIITIDIIDQNDNFPTMADQTKEIPELENGDDSHDDNNGKEILKLKPEDIDRDEAYHTVSCLFASGTTADVTNRFEIKDNSINLMLQPGVDLDREKTPSITFELNCKDDPTGQGSVSNPINPPPKVTIILTDINDNEPYVQNTDITGIDENTAKGIVATLQGVDDDDGDNGIIASAEVKSIVRYLQKGDDNPVDNTPQDLFDLSLAEDKKINVELTKTNLDGFYGYLVLTIGLTDKGSPTKSKDVDVGINVAKYNFKEPIFTEPVYDKPIYLQEEQNSNGVLIYFDGETPLENIKASDQQDNKFAIKFEITGGTGQDVFTIAKKGNFEGQLQVKSDSFDPKPYNLTIRASIDEDVAGSASTFNTKTINVGFFDKGKTDPIFKNIRSGSVKFTEGETELTYVLPENATYQIDDVPDGLTINYLLAEGDKTLFNVNLQTGVLTLIKELDYETQKTYDVVIQSSNSPSIKPDVLEETKFHLTINVDDINDVPPEFKKDSYSGILLTSVNSNQDHTITTVEASDPDSIDEGKLTFKITHVEMSDSSIASISNPFEVDSTGNIKPTFKPSSSQKGFFTLIVTVYDSDELHSATTTVKIFLVTGDNLVEFNFGNDKTTVENATDTIKIVLDDNFLYDSNVQAPISGEGDEVNMVKTIVGAYFLDLKTSEPQPSTVIREQVLNIRIFNKLKADFANVGLSLLSFDADGATTEDLEAILKAWLIGVSVVLGALCLILLVAFILKTRSLNQRIDKLSNTKFGSQESGLNRTGVTAPTTNKHAVEGSNPVYNNNEVDTKDIDRRSVTSGGSDLIGIEDDEKFDYQ